MPNPTTPADYGIPANDIAQYVPLSVEYLQDGSIPIFWGDNQTRDAGDLSYKLPSKMVQHSILSIPKVVRFLYTYDDDTDDPEGDNKDARSGGAPSPAYTWRYTTAWGEMCWLKPQYRATSGDNYLVYPFITADPYYDDLEIFDNGIGPVWSGGFGPAHATRYANVHINGDYSEPNFRVRVLNRTDGTTLFLGNVRDCFLFEFPVYRQFTWFRKRTDNGFEQFIAGLSGLSPPGTSGTAPPRRSYSDYPNGVTRTEYPPDPPYHDVP